MEFIDGFEFTAIGVLVSSAADHCCRAGKKLDRLSQPGPVAYGGQPSMTKLIIILHCWFGVAAERNALGPNALPDGVVRGEF